MNSIRWGCGLEEVVICSPWQTPGFSPNTAFTQEPHQAWAEQTFRGLDEAIRAIAHGERHVWQMRQCLAEDGEFNVSTLNDQQVIQQIAFKLTQRRLVLLRRVRSEQGKLQVTGGSSAAHHPLTKVGAPGLRSRPSADAARPGRDAPVAALPTPPVPAATTHWIEIEMIGEDDRPIAWEGYAVELPDGQVMTGHLDENGWARIEAIGSPGECRIAFPRLDRRAWSRA